jgi:hypothetical protein
MEQINVKTRRDALAIKALNPTTGKRDLEVWFKIEKIQIIGRRSKGQLLEAAELVPFVLQNPRQVFEGLCWENDEFGSRGVGWLCYSGLPSYAYRQDGTKCGCYSGEVFLVFVNDTGLVYNWRWEKSDRAKDGLPNEFDLQHGDNKRFKRSLL